MRIPSRPARLRCSSLVPRSAARQLRGLSVDEKTVRYLSEVALHLAHRRRTRWTRQCALRSIRSMPGAEPFQRGKAIAAPHGRRSKVAEPASGTCEPGDPRHGELLNVFGARLPRQGRFESTLKCWRSTKTTSTVSSRVCPRAVEVVGEVLSLERGSDSLASVQSWGPLPQCISVDAEGRPDNGG